VLVYAVVGVYCDGEVPRPSIKLAMQLVAYRLTQYQSHIGWLVVDAVFWA
jgi:hypothetical protein